MGSRVLKPPGGMRREKYGGVRRADNGSGRGSVIEMGSRDLPMAIDLDSDTEAEDHRERIVVSGREKGFGIGHGEGKDHGCRKDGVVARKLINECNVGPGLKRGLLDRVAWAANAEVDTPTDPRLRHRHTAGAGRSQSDKGSSIETPMLIDEGYLDSSFTTNASFNHNLNVKSHMIRDRVTKDIKINKLAAQTTQFQQPPADQVSSPERTDTADTYTVNSSLHWGRQETVSSDRDEDETQKARRTPQPFQFSVPHPPLDILEEPQPSQPRPTYARKTLPEQTRQPISEEIDPSKDVFNDQDEQPNEMVWGYQVIRKEWLNNEDPNDVSNITDGLYWSKDQANSIAAIEVHQERGNVRILAPMEFNMTIDALGMRTHFICSKGGSIETVVERFPISDPLGCAKGPMADKMWQPQKLFVAMENVSAGVVDSGKGSLDVNIPRKFSIQVLGVFTMLDLANRRACRRALDHRTSHFGKSELDQLLKAEKEMKARKLLERLDVDSQAFQCSMSDGSGVVKIWVEKHPVMDPRIKGYT